MALAEHEHSHRIHVFVQVLSPPCLRFHIGTFSVEYAPTSWILHANAIIYVVCQIYVWVDVNA